MRPLAVLLLVVGAIASLFFAFASLTDDSGRGTAVTRGPVVRPVLASETDEAPDPDAPLQPARVIEQPSERKDVVQVDPKDRPALTGILRVEVVDSEGNPIPDARIGLLRQAGDPTLVNETLGLVGGKAPPKPVKRGTTDASGRFEFRGLEPGPDWAIAVTHPDFTRSMAGPIAVPAEGGIDERVELSSGLALYGVVRDARNGVPIADAKLVIDTPLAAFLPSSKASSVHREATTDALGQYEFKNIGAGQRTLSITAKGYASQFLTNFSNDLRQRTNAGRDPDIIGTNRAAQLARLAAQPKEPTQWDFELQPGHQIAGRVLGPDRSGVAGVQIDAMNQSGSTGSRGTAISGRDGEFLIADLGEGIYTLRATAEGYQSTPLQRVEADRTDVEIVLAEQGGVAGRVIDSATGRPMRGFTVRIRTLHPANKAWGGEVAKATVRDSADGTFSLSGISEGDYVAEAFARGFASSFSEAFHVDQGIQTRDVTVRLTKGGTIHGRVLDAYTGQPIADAVVKTNENKYVDSEIMMILNSMGSSATSRVQTTTDENGEFTLELLTPDVYQVRVEKPGYTTIVLNDVNVSDGPPAEVGPFSLTKGAIVTGVVLGPEDEPVAGAQVTLRPTAPDSFGSYETRTDAHGNFTFENATAGTFALAASRPPTANSNPFAPVIDIQHSQIEITVADGGTYQYDLHLPARTVE